MIIMFKTIPNSFITYNLNSLLSILYLKIIEFLERVKKITLNLIIFIRGKQLVLHHAKTKISSSAKVQSAILLIGQ